MKDFQIIKVFSCKEEDYQEEFKELFKLRHDTVHTVMPLKEDVAKYHRMTEEMMKQVLVQAYEGEEYFHISKGNAFLALERHDEVYQVSSLFYFLGHYSLTHILYFLYVLIGHIIVFLTRCFVNQF